MKFDLNDIDMTQITLEDGRVELAREEQIRIGAYSKWAAEGKYPLDKLYAQLGALIRARLTLDAVAKAGVEYMRYVLTNKERVRVALFLANIAEKSPEKLVAVATVFKAFPDATLGELQAKLQPKEKAA